MIKRPIIHTAIPKQRYHYGTFHITLLGDIESPDPQRYQYIAAFVQEGEAQPTLYVTSEKSTRYEMAQGSHRLRIIMEGFEEIMDINNKWSQEAPFIQEALQIGARLLSLTDETPTRLS